MSSQAFVARMLLLIVVASVFNAAWAVGPTSRPSDAVRIADRAVTDPLVKVTGDVNTAGVLKKVDPQAQLQTHGDLVLTPHLWGKDNVFSVHPRSEKLPTLVDFSAITKSGKGVLTFYFHNALTGDSAAVIKVDGRQVQRVSVDGDIWKEAKAPFDHNGVVVEATATGWWNEHVVMTYNVEAGDTTLVAASQPSLENQSSATQPTLANDDVLKQQLDVLRAQHFAPSARGAISASTLRQQLLSANTYQKASEVEVAGGIQNLCLSGDGNVAVWRQGSKIVKWSTTQPSVQEIQLAGWAPQVLALRRDGLTAIAIAAGQLHYIDLENGKSGTASNEKLIIDSYHKKHVKPVINGTPSPWVALSPSGRFAAWGPVCVKEYQEKPQFPLIVTDTVTRRSVVIGSVGGAINDGPLTFARLSELGDPTAVADATGAISFTERVRLSPSTSGPVRAIGDHRAAMLGS